jgi:hypothetical protein
MNAYSFCSESTEPLSEYHIRKVGDEVALCGHRVECDLETKITENSLKTEEWHTCPVCNERYRTVAV